jgi:hypothetical protein
MPASIANSTDTFKWSTRARIGAIATALLLVQVPFIATKHIQEDAFITFRCVRNLVETGVYGFNPGERVSASTSHASVFIAAALKRVFADWFVPAVQLAYGAATVAGIYLLVSALVADERRQKIVWAISAVLPVSILIAYSGMETGLLVLLMGAIMTGTVDSRFSPACAAAWFLLPWVRPDAVAFGAIVLGVMTAGPKGRSHVAASYALAALVGVVSWLAFNHAYFGVWLPQTITGKSEVFLPTSARAAIVEGVSRARRMFFGDAFTPGIFVPIETKYLHVLGVPAFLITLAAGVSAVVNPVWAGVRRPAAAALVLMTFVVPLAYAAGGAPGTWYFWPSRLTGSLLVVAPLTAVLGRQASGIRRFAVAGVTAGLFVLLAGQWCYAIAWSTQERLYRGGIGEEIRRISDPHDTLLLEPAGYVPYFAERWTWDEVGVASPVITEYRRLYGSRWWIRFVQDKSPTFLLEREPMREFVTYDAYRLTRDEREWFERNYAMVREFRYDARSLRHSPLLGRISSLSEAATYLLYQRVSRSDTDMKTNQAAKVP